MLGNAKGVVAATISVLLFHNPVTAMSITGYGITVCGVVAYSQARVARCAGLPCPTLAEVAAATLCVCGSDEICAAVLTRCRCAILQLAPDRPRRRFD